MAINKEILFKEFGRLQKNLRLWKRILMNLYILGGFEEATDLNTLVDACYNWELDEYRNRCLRGTIYRTCEKLILSNRIKKYNNPVRYKLAYNKDNMNTLAYIAREVGFKYAEWKDFTL